MKNKIFLIIACFAICASFTSCRTKADTVSQNISNEADNFNVTRRLTVLNARSDKPVFELIGVFSLQVDKNDSQLELTCKTGASDYKKHFVGLNEWTIYVVEDLSGASVDEYRYEVNFFPEQILPEIIIN
ncbi:hypothetical protein FACS1894105_04340 [Clostridia bacterium]|nr:hypothetical protein FACS1894105_04340 [Clostridia bacterium]